MTPTHHDAIRATAWRHSLRQHFDVAALNRSMTRAPHWLLKSVCGRNLLVQKLRQLRPGLGYSIWKTHSALDPLLDAMVDELGLRTMPKPSSLKEQICFLHWAVAQVVSREPCRSRGCSELVRGARA
ncbi:MAG: hypothetical protein Q8S92_21435 [Hydrogenophaga sp.]|jgi:hypothetical protein|uniref:hypothetical protein n=1 Tax=Hydrogenophaga sp. TaxID=1904254 RepID=UPI0027348C6B|nr:hypothetical protein [Hydrogenophaga sp.]MDP3351560.1 hypothetical protein [Hydrogenophaga sp.]